jgi:hypothetical protein
LFPPTRNKSSIIFIFFIFNYATKVFPSSAALEASTV